MTKPSAEPPTPPDAKQVSPPPPQPVELQVAHLGLIGALVTGLIVTLLGGVIAGYFAIANTNHQLSGESARSRADFLRTQRQEAYAKFLNDYEAVDQFLLAEDETARKITTKAQAEAFNGDSQVTRFEETTKMFYYDENSVRLVCGNSNVFDQATELGYRIAALDGIIHNLAQDYVTPFKNGTDYQQAEDDAFGSVESQVKTFVDAAKKDLL